MLVVFEGYGPGGDYGVCLDLCRVLDEAGCRSKLIARSDDIDDILKSRAEVAGVQVSLYKKLATCLQETDTAVAEFDIAHVHFPGNYVPLALATQWSRLFRGRPLVLTLHGPLPVEDTCRSLRQRVSAKLAARLFDLIAVPSEHKLAELRASKLFGKRLRCLPNPVRQQPLWNQQDAREQLGLPLDRKICLWVGRIGPEKSPQFLIGALPRLRELGCDPLIAFVGPRYGVHNELQDLMDQHAESLRFLGYLPDPSIAYGACDAVVVTSRYESFSLVLFEAAMAARPIVSSDLPIALEEFSGLPGVEIYAWGDSRALAESLSATLARPPSDLSPLRETILGRFGYAAAAERYLAAYGGLLTGAKSQA